ncbi:hypothetical protein BKA70DRAFT_1198417 [Coprinopsis sp. MPI-PUGE-AT-0042]|nr:hypothetical protein BKA70DRAFT_1198417 [Coprinopsis sp. MPI-PUGE-AT-0042]
MSRRESRASVGSRQNDALYEFEAFKKKFLLANKHITKLNSTLSVRIEELNAHIQALTVENLRLRTSEIQLTSELKREREKSRKVMADAESATQGLVRHLNNLRISMNIPHEGPLQPGPPSPKARRRPVDRHSVETDSPMPPRIAQAPTVPGIEEEEEASMSPTPKRKSSKRRSSTSSLPLPSRPASTSTVHLDLTVAHSTTKRNKPLRRQSGMLVPYPDDPLSVPRASSPAFGSPVRLQAGRAELEEEMAVINGDQGVDVEVPQEKKRSRKGKAREEVYEEHEEEPPVVPVKDRKRRREGDDTALVTVEAVQVQAVPRRMALQAIDNTVHCLGEEESTSSRGRSPTPDADAGTAAGRERRARKSVVSYAEPSLKVKMRKPDGAEPQKKKRTSTSSSSSSKPTSERRSSLEQQQTEPHPPETPHPSSNAVRRQRSRPQIFHVEDEDAESDGADADGEYVPGASKKSWGNVNIEGPQKTWQQSGGRCLEAA